MTDDKELTEEERSTHREQFALFLLQRAGLNPEEIDDFWTEKKAAHKNRSPKELFAAHKYKDGLGAVETFIDTLEEK